MDFRQLDSFVMIAKLGNFSKAAKELYLTQPTISNHIKSLEDELGLSLFHRSSWQVSLTEDGELFLTFAKQLLEKREELMEAMNESIEKLKGKLAIHTSTIPETYILPDLIAQFRQANPEVQFLIKHGDSHDIIEGILDDQMSFGFCGSMIKNTKLEYLPLKQDEMVLVVAAGQMADTITIPELIKVPLILREEGSGHRDLLAKELQKHDITLRQLNVVAYSDSTETIKQLVSKGVGGAFLSRFAIEQEIASGELEIVTIKNVSFCRDFYFVTRKQAKFNQIEQAFIQLVRDQWPPA